MAINPLLSLQVESLDTATPVQNVANMRLQGEQMSQQRAQGERQERMVSLREEQLDLEKMRAEFEQQEAGEKRRLRNVALGSAQLSRVLENQGPDAAMTWLQNNREGNTQFGLPSDDTDEALQMLEQGDVDQLKTSLDNNVFVGESLGLIETPDQTESFAPVFDDEGNIVAQRNTQTGRIHKDPRAPEDPSTQVNVSVGGEKFQETLNKERAQRINTMVETGQSAVATERNLVQMGDLLAEGVQTGTAQPAIASLQGLAEDFGLDISGVAERAGIENLSNLSGKEEFDRLAKQTIIEGFEKFKGNLNDREVKLAMDAFGNLGKSEKANVKAIASLRASQSLAKERGRRASQIESSAEARALEGELFEDTVERYEKLRTAFADELSERMKQRGDVPTFDSEQAAQQAIDSGEIQVGDTVIVNGKRFRVEE